MKSLSRWSFAAVGLVALVSRPGAAQQMDEVSQLHARVAQLEKMVAENRMHFASYGGDGEHADGCCGSCNGCCNKGFVGADFFNDYCRPCTWYGAFEVVFLRPYASEGLLFNPASDIGFDPSWRVWFGRQLADGLGWRARYWEFDRGSGNVGAEFRTADLEFTQAVDYRYWTFLFAGGVRYAETSVNNSILNVIDVESGFDGVGLTVAAEAYRDLFGFANLRWATKARWSALYGNGKQEFAGIQFLTEDDVVQVVELYVGPQYSRMTNAGTLTLGIGAEAQYWSNGVSFDTQDFGFVGLAVSAQVAR